MLPKNLGRPFARRRWGLPLFGDLRPELPPDRGLLLVFTSPDGDGLSGALEAARLGPDCRLSYDERAVAIDSSGYWLGLRALSAAAAEEPPPSKGRAALRESYAYSYYRFALDRKARKRRFSGRIADPYEYVYPYFFYDTPTAAPNLARFVGDILCGVFRVPLREAEKLAEAFSERLP